MVEWLPIHWRTSAVQVDYKACLPSSGRYSLFVGNEGFRHSSSYTLRYGGKVVKKSTGVVFDTIPFGRL